MTWFYLCGYLAAGFVFLGLFAARDRWGDVRGAFWLCLFWPLTVVVAVLMLVGLGLRALGFAAHCARPRDRRWSTAWVQPYACREPDRRRRGFVVISPWLGVALWWQRPDWSRP